MDIIRFQPSATLFANGEVVNEIKSKTWIERYLDPGEFTFVADIDSGVREALPLGTAVSHVDSREIMIVENHEIAQNRGQPTDVVITGRSYETLMEQRIVGANQPSFPSASPPPQYTLAAGYPWNQAVALMNNHLLAAYTADDDDALSNVLVVETVGGTGTYVARVLPRSTLYKQLIDLLASESLGLRSWRPLPVYGSNQKCSFVVHRGVDRSATVIFTDTLGELESADYLWSDKSSKNAALITGRWLETAVKGVEVGAARRWMFIDASDLDNAYSTAPTGPERDAILSAMVARGNQALAAQNQTALIKAETVARAERHVYRTDYDLGDIVTVRGQYNESTKMRIVEYVETEDKTGEQGQPTFGPL